jgi:hypothetical protein
MAGHHQVHAANGHLAALTGRAQRAEQDVRAAQAALEAARREKAAADEAAGGSACGPSPGSGHRRGRNRRRLGSGASPVFPDPRH